MSALSRIVGALVAAPAAVALTTLGAIATAVRVATSAVVGLLPDLPAARPRHNAARVSEQVKAARRAAERSGVLSPKVPDRTGRDC